MMSMERPNSSKTISKDDFYFVKNIGKGAYGDVYLDMNGYWNRCGYV